MAIRARHDRGEGTVLSVRSRIRLITTGRRSGQPREATLYAFADGDRLVVVASQGGSTRDPHWAANLRSHPEAMIVRGKGAAPEQVHSHEASGEERDRLWALVTGISPFYTGFQRRTKRVIPLFVLERPGPQS
jgi:deazaflavin-dependent oxidoreductase (nitroreductase family)